MMLKHNFLIIVLLCFTTVIKAQIQNYSFQQNLDDVSEKWHSILLPNTVFSNVKPDLSDIRIFGITQKNDTIEAPYILKTYSEKIEAKAISFQQINTSKTANGYYFTFETSNETLINQIKLDFDTANFDWRVTLEASQNQNQWFTILDDYRLLAIKNENTDYSFTTLKFPDAKYRYYRVFVNSITNPKLSNVEILKQHIVKGAYIKHAVKNTKISKNKVNKISLIDFELESKSTVNTISINVDTDFDYYRPLKIEYLSDSLKTEKGWIYNYKTIKSATLNSLESNVFKFENTIAKKFRIEIYNGDNQPININSVSAKGYKHELIARFTEDANYSLVYGNTMAYKPNYDINRFATSILKPLVGLKLGKQIPISKSDKKLNSPLFENKYWLWGIMLIIILILGGFTLKMIKKT